MTSVIFAFDPGLNSPGGAVFVNGVLRAADAISIPGAFTKMPMGARVDAVARTSMRWFLGRLETIAESHNENALTFADELVCVYEKPTLYGGGVSEKDPDDIIHIAMVGAAFAALRTWHKITAPEPKEWNFGTKKIKLNNPTIWQGQRGQQVARRLTLAERALVPDKHDAIDAVGQGLFELGKMEPIRVNARRGQTKPHE